MLNTGLCKRGAPGEGQPGDVTDLTGPRRAESRARSSVPCVCLTSHLHPVPANAEQGNEEIRHAHLPVPSAEIHSLQGGRKDDTSLEVRTGTRADGELFMHPFASGTAQGISQPSPRKKTTLKAEVSKAIPTGAKELPPASQSIPWCIWQVTDTGSLG